MSSETHVHPVQVVVLPVSGNLGSHPLPPPSQVPQLRAGGAVSGPGPQRTHGGAPKLANVV